MKELIGSRRPRPGFLAPFVVLGLSLRGSVLNVDWTQMRAARMNRLLRSMKRIKFFFVAMVACRSIVMTLRAVGLWLPTLVSALSTRRRNTYIL